jgi:predicted transcriptional regulator
MEVANMSANEWASAITEALSNKADKVPDGWKTASELEDVFQRSRRVVATKIAHLKKQGLVESRKFTILTNRGLYPEPHYKLINKK